MALTALVRERGATNKTSNGFVCYAASFCFLHNFCFLHPGRRQYEFDSSAGNCQEIREPARRVKSSSRLATGDRVGLIGKNGTGKTTVLRLILGQGGSRPAGVVELVRIVSATFPSFRNCRMIFAATGVECALCRDRAGGAGVAYHRRSIAHRLPGRRQRGCWRRDADLVEQMNREDGWTYQHRIDTVLTQLGFRPADSGSPHSAAFGRLAQPGGASQDPAGSARCPAVG